MLPFVDETATIQYCSADVACAWLVRVPNSLFEVVVITFVKSLVCVQSRFFQAGLLLGFPAVFMIISAAEKHVGHCFHATRRAGVRSSETIIKYYSSTTWRGIPSPS